MFDGEMYVPVNKVIGMQLRGADVIHSFFVPEFRLKQDILPRRDIPAWFNATETGRFEAPCAELCGPGHSGMKGWVNVYDDAEYQAWVAEQWPPAPVEEAPVDTGAGETGQEDMPQGDAPPQDDAGQMDPEDSGQADTVE